MVKIVAISDTHNRHKKIVVPEGDVLIHAGDATGRGERGEILPFLDWLASQPHAHKVLVPGNHDWGFEKEPAYYKEECQARGIHLLIHEALILKSGDGSYEDIRLFGSPATPWFYSWAFNYRRTLEESMRYQSPWIKNIWDLIPDNTDILITHGPPEGTLDELVNAMGDGTGVHVGCEELASAIKRVKPQVHIFGHIHCGYGEKHLDGVSYYNASICGESYMVDNDPHIILF